MPVEFACACGKKLRAAEEHAGKRAKCSQCGQVAIIPAAKSEAVKRASPATPHIAPAAPVQSGRRLCPSCKSPLSEVAVLCVDCGYNLNTGKKIITAPLEDIETPKKRPRSGFYQFLVSRITSWKLWSGVGLMALAAVWHLFLTQADITSTRTGRGYIYILALFVLGGISFINGLFDGDNA